MSDGGLAVRGDTELTIGDEAEIRIPGDQRRRRRKAAGSLSAHFGKVGCVKRLMNAANRT